MFRWALTMECTAVKIMLTHPKGRPGVKKKKENTEFTKSPLTSLLRQTVGLLIDNDVVAGYSSEEGVSEAVDYGGP